MLLDRFNEFSDAQAETTVAAHVSDNVVDLGTAKKIEGKPFFLEISIPVAVTSSGSATVTFSLETDDNESFGSATTLWTSAAIGKATLVAGYRVVRLALNGLALEQYLRVKYTIGTAALTAGAFDAFLTFDADTNV